MQSQESPSKSISPYTRGATLPALLKERILILDGAMGTMIQQKKFTEEDYRGLKTTSRFANHPVDLKGNNELLVITQPEAILDIQGFTAQRSVFSFFRPKAANFATDNHS